MNRIFLALVAAVMLGGTSTAATASCIINGTVTAVTVVDDSAGPTIHIISARKGALSGDVYEFDTTDQGLVEIAVTAMTAQMQAQLEGDAAVCSGSGQFLYAGNLVEIGFF